MSLLFSNHVPSKVLGEAAQRGNLDGLRESERRHVKGCAQCKQLYGGYRLADRLLAAPWQEVKLPAEAVAQHEDSLGVDLLFGFQSLEGGNGVVDGLFLDGDRAGRHCHPDRMLLRAFLVA